MLGKKALYNEIISEKYTHFNFQQNNIFSAIYIHILPSFNSNI